MMENKDNTTAQTKVPNPGTKDALKAELEIANAKLAEAEAKLAAMVAQSGTEASEALKTEKRVPLYIPRGASNEEATLLISVNGVNYLLPKGKESMVPPHIAAEYHRAEKAKERLDRSRDRLLRTAQ